MKNRLPILLIMILSLDACSQYSHVGIPGGSTQTAIISPSSTQTAVATFPAPVSTIPEEEQRVMEAVRRGNPQSANSPGECMGILKTQPWCSIVKSAKRIERPEWTELFPSAEYYLVAYDLFGGESRESHHRLVIEQNGQRYDATSFDRLLKANRITITDTNRELAARAFILMTLGDYLEQDILISNWAQGDWDAGFGERFTYSITAWTKIQGLRTNCLYAFHDGNLWQAECSVKEYHIGEYMDVPFQELPMPGPARYFFRGR